KREEVALVSVGLFCTKSVVVQCRRPSCRNAGGTSASTIYDGSEDRMPAVIAALLKRLGVRDDGQDLLEYGLLITLIALVAMAAVSSLGSTINTVLWQPIASSF